MAGKKKFEFSEHGTYEDNVSAFFTHISAEDAVLAGELQSHAKSLSQGSYNQQAVLKELLAAIETNAQSATVPGVAAQGQTPAPAPVQTGNAAAVTGWLLEGLSIEGFAASITRASLWS